MTILTYMKGIVIGYDHRKLGTLSSLQFALVTAAVFISQGHKVYLLENFVATPFVAFAVTHLNCAGKFIYISQCICMYIFIRTYI